MIKNDAPIFGQVVTAMVTPFDADLKIDYKALEKVLKHLLDSGTTSLVVGGTTGESPTLEENEKIDLLKAVLEQAKGKAKVLLGSGSNDTAKSVKLSIKAENYGADGLLVVAPYYNKPNQEGLKAHFAAIAEAVSLPIMVYNIPGRTGININADTILSLAAEHANVNALKDSTGSVDQAGDIARKAPDTLRIYSGDDNLTLPFLSVGACGVVSVASHLIGKQIQEMISAYITGANQRAREIHCANLPLFKGLFTAPNPTCVKYALSKLGLCRETLRLPLVPLSPPQKDAMDKLLSPILAQTKVKL